MGHLFSKATYSRVYTARHFCFDKLYPPLVNL